MISVLIPDKGVTGYTLYAEGIALSLPLHVAEDGGFHICFGGTVLILFYTYKKYRAAIVVTDSEYFSAPLYDLECVSKPVKIIFQARGRKVDLLKRLKFFIETDKKEVFRYPVEFWIKLTSLIDKNFNGKESALKHSTYQKLVEEYRNKRLKKLMKNIKGKN